MSPAQVTLKGCSVSPCPGSLAALEDRAGPVPPLGLCIWQGHRRCPSLPPAPAAVATLTLVTSPVSSDGLLMPSGSRHPASPAVWSALSPALVQVPQRRPGLPRGGAGSEGRDLQRRLPWVTLWAQVRDRCPLGDPVGDGAGLVMRPKPGADGGSAARASAVGRGTERSGAHGLPQDEPASRAGQ